MSKNRRISLLNILDDKFSKDFKRKPIHRLLYNNPFISLDIHYFYETNDLFYYNYSHNGINLHLYSKEEVKNYLFKNILLMCYLISYI